MNELDAIQNQMAALGIDVSPTPEEMPMEWGELTDEELAMFWPGWELDVSMEEVPMEAPVEAPVEWEPAMPEYDIEELKIDIQPMLQWLPKEEFANLIIWMSEQFNLLNQQEINNA